MRRTDTKGPPTKAEELARLLARMPSDPKARLLTKRSPRVMEADCEYGGYYFRFFIDAGELDYLSFALRGGKAYNEFGSDANNHDGKVPGGMQWHKLDRDPLLILTHEEHNALELWLIGE